MRDTIDLALWGKLGRGPTHNELVADVKRILAECSIKASPAEEAKLAALRQRCTAVQKEIDRDTRIRPGEAKLIHRILGTA